MGLFEKIKGTAAYRNKMAPATARLQSIAHSASFIQAVGKEAADQLSDIAVSLRDTYESEFVDDELEAYSKLKGLKPLLKRKTKDGRKIYDVMKSTAIEQNLGIRNFYEDMYYLSEMLETDLDMESMDPSSVSPKTDIPGERSWANYCKAHLTDIPYSLKGKADHLSKALLSAFLAGERDRNPDAKEVPFSVPSARKLVESISKKPLFKQISKDPILMDKLLKEGAKDPSILFDTAVRMKRPFYHTPKATAHNILGNLQKMLPLLDGPQTHDSKWKDLYESIQSIDLNDPEKSGEKKLQEILEKTEASMKGKKSLRRSQADRNAFDQSMDVLAELAKCNDVTRAAALKLVDRTNEVRFGHSKTSHHLSLREFGMSRLPRHTNSTDVNLVSVYRDNLSYKAKEPEKRYVRNIFQPYPMQDFTLLERVPKGTMELKVRDGIKSCREFASDQELSKVEAAGQLTSVLALSDCQMYYHERKEIGKSTVVFDSNQFMQKTAEYMVDPAVQKLAEQMRDPNERKKYTIGGGDSFSFDADKLKERLAEVKKEMEKPGPAPTL